VISSSPWSWSGTVAAIPVLLGLDFLVAAWHPQLVGLAEAG
jgi:hypothetical protein